MWLELAPSVMHFESVRRQLDIGDYSKCDVRALDLGTVGLLFVPVQPSKWIDGERREWLEGL